MSMPWETGLCSCLDDKSGCCDTIFCPWCQMGRQWTAVNTGQVNTGNCPVCVVSCLGPMWAILNVLIRFKVVEKYNIDEGKIGSCCMALICPGCSFCQTHRQLSLMNAWPGGACCQSKPYEKMMV